MDRGEEVPLLPVAPGDGMAEDGRRLRYNLRAAQERGDKKPASSPAARCGSTTWHIHDYMYAFNTSGASGATAIAGGSAAQQVGPVR